MNAINVDTLEWFQVTFGADKQKAILILKPHINDLGIIDAFDFLEVFVLGEVAHGFAEFHDLGSEFRADVGIGGEFGLSGIVQVHLFSSHGIAGEGEDSGHGHTGEKSFKIHDSNSFLVLDMIKGFLAFWYYP